MDSIVVRPFRESDEASWLRCRVLSFLDSNYFDDVLTAKPTYALPSVELVAVLGDQVVGVLDVAIDGALATVETIATHPDHARRGVAHELLGEALRVLPSTTITLDAWTRENFAANAWYQSCGFRETFRYLHVYSQSDDELASSIVSSRGELTPVAAFFHASIEDEVLLRAEYERVYVCRRYELALQLVSSP